MLKTTVPVKNPVLVLLKAMLLGVVYQIFVFMSLFIGFIIEDKFAYLETNDFNFMILPDHRVLAWTGLTVLLLILPLSGLVCKFALRSRSPDFYFLKNNAGKLVQGILGGIFLSVAVIAALVISGHGKIIATPGRLIPQAIWASFLGYGLLMLFIGYFEEMLCRGLLMCEWSLCARSWVAGITISGFLFGLIHVLNIETTGPERFRIVISGILFSWFLAAAMLRYRSLYLAVGIHAGWNYGLGGLMGCVVSGQRLNLTLFQTDISGPDWITGGSFGLETSLVVNTLLLVLIWLIWRGIDLDSLARWKRLEEGPSDVDSGAITGAVNQVESGISSADKI